MVGQQAVGVGCGDQLYVVCIALKKEAIVFGRAEDSLAVVAAVVDVVEVSWDKWFWVCHIRFRKMPTSGKVGILG